MLVAYLGWGHGNTCSSRSMAQGFSSTQRVPASYRTARRCARSRRFFSYTAGPASTIRSTGRHSRIWRTSQIVYLDHRGNGRSSGNDPVTWNLAQWAGDVKAFCGALGIEKPIVYGASFGRMVALSYATRHPEHPGKAHPREHGSSRNFVRTGVLRCSNASAAPK